MRTEFKIKNWFKRLKLFIKVINSNKNFSYTWYERGYCKICFIYLDLFVMFIFLTMTNINLKQYHLWKNF